MQAIYDIAKICTIKGVKHAVLSPGSRCAPLTLSFANTVDIQSFVIPDERSAAFIALGLSRLTKSPTVLVCTSGSAGYNYAPAVAEAYFQQLPLLILTADRPPEWIDQLDGQTIRQDQLYGNHVKASFTFPVDLTHPDAQWHCNRIVNEAINLANEFPPGPVHLNIPLREPLYPKVGIEFSKSVRVIEHLTPSYTLSKNNIEELLEELKKFYKLAIVAGQASSNKALTSILQSLDIPVFTDIISNQRFEDSIAHHDLVLSDKKYLSDNELIPEVIITFGNSIISKALKVYLRTHGCIHWHIQESGYVADTFQSLSKIIPTAPGYLFQLLKENNINARSFKKYWLTAQKTSFSKIASFFSTVPEFSEFEALYSIVHLIPSSSILHLANSMPVRYANVLNPLFDNVEVVANRGTSGIDGTISTAVGTALATSNLVVVLTGDMSFLYDRNALWNNVLPTNLRIVVLNNHGGGIFRMIDGPTNYPEGEEYFVTKQLFTAENTVKDTPLVYEKVTNRAALAERLKHFFSASNSSKVLEIETDGNTNTKVWKQFKQF